MQQRECPGLVTAVLSLIGRVILRGYFFGSRFCLYNGDNKIGSACYTWLLENSERVKAL